MLDPNLVKGTWTVEEDAKLKELIAIHGPRQWDMIATHLEVLIYIYIYICVCVCVCV